MGGLGNQLHQICFAQYLQDNGYTVYLNEDWYKNFEPSAKTTKRNLFINPSYFGLNKSGWQLKNKYYNLEKVSESKLLNKVYHSNINQYYKTFEGDEFSENKYYSNSRFIGYWQNPKYFRDKKQFLVDGLMKDPNFNEESTINSEQTVIHIRAGDYVDWKENLPISYFENALSKLNQYENIKSYDIFTDIQNIDPDISLFNNATNIFNNTSENPILTFSNMKNYKNYIISNSSFSMFASFIGSNENSLIFYPEPWFKSLPHTAYARNNWQPIKY